MVPKINHRGHSFKGVMAYLMHDKESNTSERVAWHETGNMHTHDLENAAKVMAWTDRNADVLKRDFGGSTAGRKTEQGGVYHYSLSWAHSEQPDSEHQRAQGLKTLEQLGLDKHQFIMVAHSDTDHAHIHIVANLTDPETGKRHVPSFDKRELQSYALEYEREHGLQCPQREENAAKRERGEFVKHQDKKQDYRMSVTRAYYAADNGQAFIHALHEEGLQLAAARRGNAFVIVDDKGDIQKLARQLDIAERGKAKTAAINAKLSDINRDTLPDPDQLSKQVKTQAQEPAQTYDRDAEEVQQQKYLSDGAQQAAADKAKVDMAAQKVERENMRKQAQEQAAQTRREALAAKHEKQESLRRYQYKIDEKTAASRKKWQIDELTKAKIKAKVAHDKLNTGFGRFFRRKKIAEAHDHWQDMSKRLTERRGRWLADIEAFNKKRPEWIQAREREKYGFGKAKDSPKQALHAKTKTNALKQRVSQTSKQPVKSWNKVVQDPTKRADVLRAEFDKMRKERDVDKGVNDNKPILTNRPKRDIEP